VHCLDDRWWIRHIEGPSFVTGLSRQLENQTRVIPVALSARPYIRGAGDDQVESLKEELWLSKKPTSIRPKIRAHPFSPPELVAAEPTLENSATNANGPVPLEAAVRAGARRVVSEAICVQGMIADLARTVATGTRDGG
jgi:hypothetical protein